MKRLRLIYSFVSAILILFGCSSAEDHILFFKDTGRGETIIFVHGSQEDYRVFMPQLELLCKEFHVVTYSRRYNYPNKTLYQEGTPFNPMTEAEDLEILRQQLKIEKFNVVGHSYGGLIALAYANKYHDRLESVTISEPPVLGIEGCQESLTATKEGLIEKLKASFKTNDTTIVMKAIFEFFVGEDIQDQIPPEALQMLKSNLAEMEALSNSEDPFPSLNSTFEIPTLILTSEHVMPVLMCTNASLINSTPDAKHVKVPGTSHDMWMTHPEVLYKYLKEFLLNN